MYPHYTLVNAIKDKTAIAVNIMVGISITTADPTFVPKKEIAAIHPLKEGKMEQRHMRMKSTTVFDLTLS